MPIRLYIKGDKFHATRAAARHGVKLEDEDELALHIAEWDAKEPGYAIEVAEAARARIAARRAGGTERVI